MDIPSRYNPQEVEPRILEMWSQGEYFFAQREPGEGPFSIVIPPPNITGILHMGHALNNTIQDVLVRFKRMQGYQALWMPGTDHAGIATQNVVEKDLAREGLRKEDIGREKFLERLWQWREKYGSTILNQLKILGASCDWRRTRFTMDEEYSEAVKEVFVRLYEKNLIYRGNYIINWCPRCKTALSDEEAARRQIDGWLYYIKYPVLSEHRKPQAENCYITVATTRPETMLGDTAIAINPSDERYSWLIAAKIILPIIGRELRVIQDDAVDKEFGTGVVKVTPAHDPADFVLGKKYNLDFVNIMNPDATLNENAGEFSGMDRFEARQAILELLEEKKLIEKKEPYKISAGHCYRCHTIIEPRVSLQWFVRIKPLAEPAIKAVKEDRIRFYPEKWKKVYLSWMDIIQDWCISRQIWWGHRIPVYYCKKCQEQLVVSDERLAYETENRKPQTANRGIIVSRSKPKKCPDCGSVDLVQDEDVLDTWFSSWLWPFATFYWPFTENRKPQTENRKKELEYFYPTDVLVTASEIIFFWVARMIMAGLEFMRQVPFRDVFIHGTVRDERGIKMSKSLGNIIDPLEVIGKFGADALRFSLMLNASSGSDIYLSDEKFLVGRNFSNKIWNATRFILQKTKEHNFTISGLKLDKLDDIDRWLLSELGRSVSEVTKNLDNYRINEATKVIYEFFWHTFCDWYIEIVKDNFTLARAEALVYVLLETIKLMHPVMPFISEEIFQLIKAETSLSLGKSITRAKWPQQLEFQIEGKELERIYALVETIKALRNIKTDLGLAQKKITLELKSQNEHRDYLQMHEAWIKRLAILEKIEFKENLERSIYKTSFWELNFDMANTDMANFLSSLDKKIINLETVFNKSQARLNNEKFIQNAAQETVQEEKDKFNQLNIEIGRLRRLRNAFK